jgi:hypothetical protein
MSDADLYDTKEYKKAVKIMGEKNAREFIRRDTDNLKNLIAMNKVHVQDAELKTKANDAYKKACETKSDFERGLRDTKKPLEIASSLAAMVLRDRKEHK